MPGQGKAKGTRRNDGAASAAASDPRFASMTTDPRFRLPSARHSRVGVDQRFSRMFKDDDFSKKATVDRYGRKVAKGNAKKELERFYKIEDGEQESDEEEEGKAQKLKGKSKAKPKKAAREVVGSGEESEDEVEAEVADDSEVERELQRLEGRVRDPAREGGFSSSSDESSSEDESELEIEADEDAEVEFPAEQAAAVPMGEVSSRLAVVNLDWDNIRSTDLMAVAQSFAAAGRVSHVVVYPSEFGKERMQKEELEGPPRDIFARAATKDEDEDTDDEEERIKKQLLKEDTGEEFDSAKLRQYQLDRLKYYYAVITCDSKETAKALYDGMDGREYLSTANFFDLRFIPDEVDFSTDTPRDECSKLPAGYKPNEFVTDALTHSKVRLTWDADDTTRKEVQKRAFSRAEIDENDLQAYIGSDSSDGEDEDSGLSKAEQQRQKMRAALGLTSEPTKASKSKDDGPVGDMQITFTSGLSSNTKDGAGANSVFENDPILNETTREKYIRKEKERKARRKEKMKASREGGAAETEDAPATTAVEEQKGEEQQQGDDQDPFNDPFFNDTLTAQKAEKAARKADRLKKREAREAAEAATAAQRAELELLMVDDKNDNMRHFDMNAIAKAEKDAKKKNKGRKNKGVASAELQDDFNIETKDPRFAGLYDSHEFAIDPTNPRFKGTSGMKALLEEGRKKRKNRGGEGLEDGDAPPVERRREKKVKVDGDAASGGGEDLKSLLARVKAKTKAR